MWLAFTYSRGTFAGWGRVVEAHPSGSLTVRPDGWNRNIRADRSEVMKEQPREES